MLSDKLKAGASEFCPHGCQHVADNQIQINFKSSLNHSVNIMINIAFNIDEVRERVSTSKMASQRSSEAVTLLAVSKTRSADEIGQAMAAGITDFGENYLQEAIGKIDEISSPAIKWHFIGPIQGNKTRPISELFHWVHTVDRLKIAERLNSQRPEHLPPLNICIQVNIDNETGKAGVDLKDLPDLASSVDKLPHLKLRGLMIIPKRNVDENARAETFALLAKTLNDLKAKMPSLDTLSMGMSDDYPLAIQQGATIIRLGTAIFGPRNNSPQGEKS